MINRIGAVEDGMTDEVADEGSGESDANERYVEAVLAAVETIPPGRVASYGDVAEHVGVRLGRGGPRQVGSVMAQYGASVAWWRVVRADGRTATGHETRALRELLAEGAPLRGDRVVMREARWHWTDQELHASETR